MYRVTGKHKRPQLSLAAGGDDETLFRSRAPTGKRSPARRSSFRAHFAAPTLLVEEEPDRLVPNRGGIKAPLIKRPIENE
jgi:hypothetical protein